MCVHTHVCAHTDVCALLVLKSQYIGVHNSYFSFVHIFFLSRLNLGFVAAIISSTKTGPNFFLRFCRMFLVKFF